MLKYQNVTVKENEWVCSGTLKCLNVTQLKEKLMGTL